MRLITATHKDFQAAVRKSFFKNKFKELPEMH